MNTTTRTEINEKLNAIITASTDTTKKGWVDISREACETLEAIDDICSFNGYLDSIKKFDDRIESMDALVEWASMGGYWANPLTILQKAFHGYAYNPFREDSREAFNPNHDYFYLDGYANLVSVEDKHDALRYLTSIIDIDEYLDYADGEGHLEEIADILDIDIDTEETEETED